MRPRDALAALLVGLVAAGLAVLAVVASALLLEAAAAALGRL